MGILQAISILTMAKKKNKAVEEEVKPIELPEEEDEKVLPIPTEDDEAVTDELDEEDEEETEADGDVF